MEDKQEVYEAADELDQDQLSRLEGLLETRGLIDNRIKELTGDKKKLTEALTEILADTGCPKITTPDWNVTVSAPTVRRRLDREQLILAGVTVAQLTAGELESHIAGTLRVTRRKNGDTVYVR